MIRIPKIETLNGGVTAISAVPAIGWGIGGAYTLVDLGFTFTTGESIGDRLDKSLGNGVIYKIPWNIRDKIHW